MHFSSHKDELHDNYCEYECHMNSEDDWVYGCQCGIFGFVNGCVPVDLQGLHSGTGDISAMHESVLPYEQ